MAWNNRDKEPRREWTEQIIGILAVLIYIPLVFYGMSFVPATGADWWGLTAMALLISWMVVLLLCALPFLAWDFLHAIGELVCEIMTGVFEYDPRPVRVRDRWGSIVPEKDRSKT